MTPTVPRLKGWRVGGPVLAFFAIVSLVAALLLYQKRVRADNAHVFELMIYHTRPGKASELEAIFRDDSRLMAKHGIKVVGFWVPNEDPAWKPATS